MTTYTCKHRLNLAHKSFYPGSTLSQEDLARCNIRELLRLGAIVENKRGKASKAADEPETKAAASTEAEKEGQNATESAATAEDGTAAAPKDGDDGAQAGATDGPDPKPAAKPTKPAKAGGVRPKPSK